MGRGGDAGDVEALVQEGISSLSRIRAEIWWSQICNDGFANCFAI